MDINNILSFIEENIQQPLWGNWYIKERIGVGSFSRVYSVEAKRLNRTDRSALKIEPITAGDTLFMDEGRKRNYIERKRVLVENESTIMYKLKRCPYVVAYEDEDMRELVINGKFEGYYFLIRMEFLTCISDLIYDKKMDLSESNILKLARHIGKGIKAAHEIGIIHRDIKPGNFFVSDDGIYRLGDFNVSKLSDTARTFAGTGGYLAPEIYRAKSDVNECYTKQADIYSFGICLYQLMNDLYLPFEDTLITDDAILKRMTGEKLPKPKNASEEFSRIILKACAFEMADRYLTMDEFLDDLKKITSPTAGEGVGVGAGGSIGRSLESDPFKTIVADSIFEGVNSMFGENSFENVQEINNQTAAQAIPVPILNPNSRSSKNNPTIQPDTENVPMLEYVEEDNVSVEQVEGISVAQISLEEESLTQPTTSQSVKEMLTDITTSNTSNVPATENAQPKHEPKNDENKIIAISAGWKHTVGLKANGTAVAVGENKSKQCDVGMWSNIVGISAGYNRTLGLKSDGTVVDSLGTNAFDNWNNIKAALAGDHHAVGLRNDGTVVATGDNASGRCEVNGWRNIVAIAVGSEHTVGLMSNGRVVATGYNRNGECNVEGWSDIIAISANAYYTVGLKSNGTVVTLGLSSVIQSEVQKWNNVIEISAGNRHTVALKADGTVVAVGSNSYGECEVSGWRDIVAIATGWFHTVGLKKDGTVLSVGNNRSGQCNGMFWNKLN